ncbi:hypothetical protein C0J52_25106 [Blattella germanica]|nr:hypothetical protein C0J52_25106 [Blattella germanica]
MALFVIPIHLYEKVSSKNVRTISPSYTLLRYVLIWHGVESVTEEMLAKTWREIEYRLDASRAINGAHIEVYP